MENLYILLQDNCLPDKNDFLLVNTFYNCFLFLLLNFFFMTYMVNTFEHNNETYLMPWKLLNWLGDEWPATEQQIKINEKRRTKSRKTCMLQITEVTSREGIAVKVRTAAKNIKAWKIWAWATYRHTQNLRPAKA